MTSDELLSKTIDYLRFPLCVGIVFAHFNLSKGLEIHGVRYGLENPDWYFFFLRLVNWVLPSLIVPMFFIFSGLLFFYRKDFSAEVYVQKLKSRMMTLLVPYILWNIIAILWRLKCLLPGISSFYRPVEIKVSSSRIFNTFFCNVDNSGIIVGSTLTNVPEGILPIDGPLWFVRELMLMVVISPVIYWLIKKGNLWFLSLLGIVWFCSSWFLLNDSFLKMYASQFLMSLFFFSWGAFYSINRQNLVLVFRRFYSAPFIYILLAIADALTQDLEYNGLIHNTGLLAGVVSMVVVASHLLEFGVKSFSRTLVNSCFFIYALHDLFITEVGKIAFLMLHVPEKNPHAMLSLYLIVSVFTTIGCLFLYMSLRRYAPRMCNLLTGGR